MECCVSGTEGDALLRKTRVTSSSSSSSSSMLGGRRVACVHEFRYRSSGALVGEVIFWDFEMHCPAFLARKRHADAVAYSHLAFCDFRVLQVFDAFVTPKGSMLRRPNMQLMG